MKMVGEIKAFDSVNKGVHLLGAIVFSYGLYYYFTYVNIPAQLNPLDEAFGGKFKYLTFCDMVIQTSFYLFAVFIDQIARHLCSDSMLKVLSRIKNVYFTSLAFPLAMFIAMSFWPLWFTDKTLVMPKYYDIYFPNWLNHVTHAFIFYFAVLEMLTSYRKYPSRSAGLSIFMTFQFFYLFWINFVFYKSGMWVYPILKRMNLLMRILFFAGNVMYAPATYLAGEYLNNSYWRVLKHSKSSKHLN
ncbi:androgen-induced gene 1 protein-like [Daktulosphaira vitifoliae]|uniref:androgen-induced gene 1 protein-like n=1 Tax=Daktulosphaira vitifoliae TaxID=58002 RepID=UPI0021A9A11B|nr:androgen-induced gene 1 protein-like [Daktulosphaira vitifoliae]